MVWSCLCSQAVGDMVASVWVVQQPFECLLSCEISSCDLSALRWIVSAEKVNFIAVLMHRQEGWLELDAYYTGANRGKDPSDLGPQPPKPDEPLILPNDSAADLTNPPSSSLAAAKTGTVADAVTR